MSSEARELARRIVEDVAASYSVPPTAPACDPPADADDPDVAPEPVAPVSSARATARRIVDAVFAAAPSTDVTSSAADERPSEDPDPVLATDEPGHRSVLASGETDPTGDATIPEELFATHPAAKREPEGPSEADAPDGPADRERSADVAPSNPMPGAPTGPPPGDVVVDITDEAILETPAVAELPAGADGTDAAARPDPTVVAARIVEDVLAAQRAADGAQMSDATASPEEPLDPGIAEPAVSEEPLGSDVAEPVATEATFAPPAAERGIGPAAFPPGEVDVSEPGWLEVSDEHVEPAYQDGPPPVPPKALAGDQRPSGTEPAAEVRPLDEELTVALEFEEPSRAGRWLLMTVIGAIGLAVLFPLAVAAIRQLLSMS